MKLILFALALGACIAMAADVAPCFEGHEHKPGAMAVLIIDP